MRRITFSAPCLKRYDTDELHQSDNPVFAPISLTGSSCTLGCDHCKGRLLNGMYTARTPDEFRKVADRLGERGCRGLLITGGCERDGTIPLQRVAAAAGEAKARWGFRVAVHTKLVTESFVQAVLLAGTDLLMLDLVGDLDALHQVYHLHGQTLDCIGRSIDLAVRNRIPLAPHIVIGINRGQIGGEYAALEMLDGVPFETLVLVVLTPLRMTPLAGTEVDLTASLRFIEHARSRFPEARIALGCAKGSGDFQLRMEEKALELGFCAIAYPSEGMVQRARELGFEVEFSEMCCAV